MVLRNAFENLGLDSTLQAIRDRLPTLVNGRMPTSADVTDRAMRSLGVVRIGTPAQILAGHEATAFPGQQSLRVSPEPSQLFIDFFDTAQPDPLQWTFHGNVTTTIGSFLAIEPGTAAGASAGVQSVPTFVPTADAFVRLIFTMTIGPGTTTGNYRFIGFGMTKASPTVDSAMLNGAGFEIRPDATMWAVLYYNGTRTFEQQVPRPTDSNWHRYSVQTKTSQTLFYLDGADVPVARALLVQPGIANLPIRAISLNGSTALTAATMMRLGVTAVADTGRNNTSISDGRYSWRKAIVDDGGALAVSIRPARGATATAPGVLTVTDTAQLLVPANPNRLSLTIQNPTNAAIYVGYGAAPTTANGLIIPSTNGVFHETSYTGAIWLLGSGNPRNCPYVEVRAV